MASRRDLIVAAVISTLETITVANGYNVNLATGAGGGGVQEMDPVENVVATLPVVFVQVDGESKDESQSSHYFTRALMRLAVTLVPSLDGAATVRTAVDDLVEDMERALLAQALADPVLGIAGVEHILLGGYEQGGLELMAGQVDEGAIYEVTIVYRHDVDDPRSYSA